MDRSTGRNALSVAIELLGRKELSVYETRQKLETMGLDAAEIEEAVNRLLDRRILNDRRLAERLAQVLVAKGYAAAMVQHRLAKRGISTDDAEAALQEFRPNAIEVLLSRRWKSLGQAARFLSARGFDSDEVRQAIESHFGEPPL